jgi:hypothetical protein
VQWLAICIHEVPKFVPLRNIPKNIPRYYIYHKVRNRSFVKNLGHRDFRVFSTRRTPAWRNSLHHQLILDQRPGKVADKDADNVNDNVKKVRHFASETKEKSCHFEETY